MGEDTNERHRRRKWEEIVATHLFAELETGLALLPARVDMISSRLAADISRITSTKNLGVSKSNAHDRRRSSFTRSPILSNNQPGAARSSTYCFFMCVVVKAENSLCSFLLCWPLGGVFLRAFRCLLDCFPRQRRGTGQQNHRSPVLSHHSPDRCRQKIGWHLAFCFAFLNS